MAPDDEPLPAAGEAVRRLAHDELREALVDLHDAGRVPPAEVARSVAARCRRVVALLRLAEAAAADADPEARSTLDIDLTLVRRTDRLLSPVLDAHAALDALEQLDAPGADAVGNRLAQRAAALDEQLASGCVTSEVAVALLAEVDGHVDRWPVPGPGDELEVGIRRTYAEARRAIADPERGRELVHALAEQLRFAGLQHDDVDALVQVLDAGHDLDALAGELDLRTPVGVAAVVRGHRDEMRAQARSLAASTFAAAPEAWLGARRQPNWV